MLRYLIIALFAILISAYFYLHTVPGISRGRRALLGFLRGISIVILLLLLLSPIIYYYRDQRRIPEIVVLRDVSSSMELKSANGQKSVWLTKLADKYRDAFAEAGYKIREYDFASGLEGDPANSLLAPTLTDLAEKLDLSNVRGIVLASDGWLHDESLTEIERSGIPFYVLADSSGVKARDIILERTQNNRYAYRNEPSLIRAEIKSIGYDGEAVAILKISGKEVERKAIRLQRDKSLSVDFTRRFAQTGFYPYSVEVSAQAAGERTLENNVYPGAIEVLSDKDKVVVITDKPGWDNKFIQDVIAGNQRWEAFHYTLREGQLYLGEKAVSGITGDAPALCVVINNGSLNLSPAVSSFLAKVSTQGTGLLYLGSPVPGLGEYVPIKASNVTSPYNGFLSWTTSADAYPMMALDAELRQDIPPVDYYYVTAAAGADVLARINNPQNSPAIVARSAGNAKSVAFALLNLWKWQMQGGNDGYAKLLNNILTWLSNRSSGNYQAIYNNSYFRGEEVAIRLRVDDDIRQTRLDMNPLLKVFDAKDKEVFSDYMTANGEEYQTGLKPDKPGQYRFEISDKLSKNKTGGRFSVSERSIEDRDHDYNLPLLSWIASASSGKLLHQGSDYKPIPAEITKTTETKEVPLYRKWYILALFILAFSLELFLRRRMGLL